LALGEGLLIYAGAKAKKAAGISLVSIEDRTAKIIAGVSALLLLFAVAWDWIGKARPTAAPDSTIGNIASPVVGSSATSGIDDNKPSAEEAAYIKSNLRLYDLTSKYYDSMLDGRVPGVDFKIQNAGNRTLNRVKVRVIFQDADGKPIAEEEYSPVWVIQGGYSMNDDKPLRPNYIWQNEPDKFYSAKSVPSEWQEGKVTATISDIEFAPN